jgi:DNA adenine methylase
MGSKAGKVKDFFPMFPHDIHEYREPFLGCGIVMQNAIRMGIAKYYWGNDTFFPVYNIHYQMQDAWEEVYIECQKWIDRIPHNAPAWSMPKELVVDIRKCFVKYLLEECKKLYHTPEAAAQAMVLLSLTYAGQFNNSATTMDLLPDRVRKRPILNRFSKQEMLNYHNIYTENVSLTCIDYEGLMQADGKNVFLFLDPPYDIKDSYYGIEGSHHEGFDHDRFANACKECKHSWMITYNDNERIRQRFQDYTIIPLQYKYSRGNFVTELVIINYAPPKCLF